MERLFSKGVVFKRPKIGQPCAYAKTNGPVVIFSLDWKARWTTLRVTLNAGVVSCISVHLGWIENVLASWMRDVLITGSVAAFAANIPLCNPLCVNAVADRMAPSHVGPVGRPMLSFG